MNKADIKLSLNEVRLILRGLKAEKETLFLGSTEEQYQEYHSEIDSLMERLTEAKYKLMHTES